MKNPELVNFINPEITDRFKTIDELGMALGIELHIATKSEDCECGKFFCEYCCSNYDNEYLFKKITIDGDEYCFCSKECYDDWLEENGEGEEYEEQDED